MKKKFLKVFFLSALAIIVNAHSTLSFSNKSKIVAPFDFEISIEDYNANENSCLIKINILSQIEAENVFVDLELPEDVDVVNGDKSLLKSSILKMNEPLSLSKKIIFLHDGIFKIGARITLIEGTAKTSKLALKFVKIENQNIAVFDSMPKTNNYKKTFIEEKETLENKKIIKSKQIKEQK